MERVLFFEGFQHGQYAQEQLTVPSHFLPEGTKELLWVHPLDLDFNEVLSRLKTKKYERLLIEDGFRSVRSLPQIALSQDKA